ncbi:hypothetical protein COY31_01720 [Candidatus Wolfebacteria bacterium CG_4_10_14_0_2_um_filter_39_18]|uniref:DUF5652 domain-containing protein n=1 Tax=Candidatus Wolfebacteria bacterium CG_4_10_14_0_2_um_filter_39_18 TaxID=1975061 RepID=A0A2M7TFV5_9BACT|nr:MAG: hypothetical protein COY31_01720 [Candidatus Wolfebacteria bacterium CG_4_10_14_0_2_um_filter_39_18]
MMNGWFGGLGFWIWPIIIWSIIWKGLALWKASRLGSKPWFVVLLLVNTAGILEILYLYIFSKKVAPVKEEK